MTRLEISPPDHASVRHIMANARARDVYEVSAVVGVWAPEWLADEIVRDWAARGVFGAVYGTSHPIAVLTLLRETPGSVQAGLIATDEFPSIALGVTRHVMRVVQPMIRKAGIRRAECRCWSGHHDARRWLSLCGAREETEVPGYGAGGETFIQMAWS